MTAMESDMPMAVVLGGDVNGLGVVRSLAQGGIPIALLDTNLRTPAMRTRHGVKLRVRSLEGEWLVEDLLALRCRLGGPPPVLFATRDETVMTISAFRAQLSSHYRFTMPDHDVVTSLITKFGFQHIAEAVDAPVPRSVNVVSPQDLSRLSSLSFPCAIKPSVRTPAYEANFAKAYRVASEAEVAALVVRMLEVVPNVIVQEWIEGGDDSIYFCLVFRDAQGTNVSAFSGRKIYAWPRAIGATASCLPAPEVAAELEALTAEFFERVGVVGMASMEYKRNCRDGRFVMVEPTIGRTDAQEEVASLNGINIPLAAYAVQCGLALQYVRTVPNPIIWRRNLLANVIASWHGPRSHVPSYAANTKDGIWRFDDPMPGVAHYSLYALKALEISRVWGFTWINRVITDVRDQFLFLQKNKN
jgi:D-aspartate ligase